MTEEADKPPSLTEEEFKALDYIARTPEGRLLHRFLRRVLEAVVEIPDASALLIGTGRRSLARDLMRHMASGISDTGRADAGSGSTTNDAILTGPSKPVDASRRVGRGGTRRRVNPDTRTSYDGPDTGNSGGAS